LTAPKILNKRFEQIAFYILLALALLEQWWFRAFISMDGPAHLYNASLLNLYNSSDLVKGFFDKNFFYLPNYLSHWLLQGLLNVFDPLVAEKIFLSIIVVFLPITFRLLVRKITKDTPYYSFLIFPIVFSSLLHHGFYNFCLGFVLFNCQMILTMNLTGGYKRGQTIIFLFITSVLLFYCHLFGFGLSLLTNGLLIAIILWKDKKAARNKLFLFFGIHIPTLVLTLLFIITTKVTNFDYDFEPHEKSIGLLTFSPSIIFDNEEELPYTVVLSVMLISLIVSTLTLRWQDKVKLHFTDLFFLLGIAAIYVIYHSKDGDLGGMFVLRLLHLTFFFMLLWTACNARKGYITLAALVISLYVLFHLVNYRNKALPRMEQDIVSIQTARQYIPDKSIVQVVSLTDIWFQQHWSNYLGINKEVILFENYEASLAWFPLIWNHRILEGKSKGQSIEQQFKPDYIFLYGKDPKVRDRLTDSLVNFLATQTVKLYQSPDTFCTLYQQKR
jgi:hypothetical protein